MIVYSHKFKKLVSLAETTMYKKGAVPMTYYIPRYLDLEEKDGKINLIVTDTQNNLEYLRITDIKLQALRKELVAETQDGREVVKNNPVYEGYLFAKINSFHDDKYEDGILVSIFIHACENFETRIDENRWQITIRYDKKDSFYNNSMDCAVLVKDVVFKDSFEYYTPDSSCQNCNQLNTDCEDSNCNYESKKANSEFWNNPSDQSESSISNEEAKQRRRDEEDYLNDGDADFFSRRDEDAIDRAFWGDDN